MSVHIDTWAWFNTPFTDNKEYNHCKQRSRTRAKRRKKETCIKESLSEHQVFYSSLMAVVHSEFIGCSGVDQEWSQITDNQQINRIHYRKTLTSCLPVYAELLYSVGNSLNRKNLTSLIVVKAIKTLQSTSWSHLSPLALCTLLSSSP